MLSKVFLLKNRKVNLIQLSHFEYSFATCSPRFYIHFIIMDMSLDNSRQYLSDTCSNQHEMSPNYNMKYNTGQMVRGRPLVILYVRSVYPVHLLTDNQN